MTPYTLLCLFALTPLSNAQSLTSEHPPPTTPVQSLHSSSTAPPRSSPPSVASCPAGVSANIPAMVKALVTANLVIETMDWCQRVTAGCTLRPNDCFTEFCNAVNLADPCSDSKVANSGQFGNTLSMVNTGVTGGAKACCRHCYTTLKNECAAWSWYGDDPCYTWRLDDGVPGAGAQRCPVPTNFIPPMFPASGPGWIANYGPCKGSA